jgi:hypothetical protein
MRCFALIPWSINDTSLTAKKNPSLQKQCFNQSVKHLVAEHEGMLSSSTPNAHNGCQQISFSPLNLIKN